MYQYNGSRWQRIGNIHTSDAFSTTLQNVRDRNGNTTPLQLATNRIALGTSTGTSLLNFPDAGTTAADGISFGSNINLFRASSNQLSIGSLNSFLSNSFLSTNYAATIAFSLNSGITQTPNTLTGSSATSALSIAQTWNTTGNPALIFANVTNTASGATSTLMSLQTNGINQFKVNKSNSAGVTIGNDGATTISGSNYRAYISWVALRLHFKDDTGTERMNIGNEGVAIGKPDANNVASSILELQSTTKGFLPPRMTATQGSAIASPAEGLLIYVTNTNGTFTAKGWWGYNGSTWEKLNN